MFKTPYVLRHIVERNFLISNRHSRLCFVDGSVVSEMSQGRHSQDGFSPLRKLEKSCKVCFRIIVVFALLSLVLKTVPVNLKDRDAFHLTIEEYLQSLISLIEELVLSKRLTPRKQAHIT